MTRAAAARRTSFGFAFAFVCATRGQITRKDAKTNRAELNGLPGGRLAGWQAERAVRMPNFTLFEFGNPKNEISTKIYPLNRLEQQQQRPS